MKLTILCVVPVLVQAAHALKVHPDTIAERHSITKRFADVNEAFTDYDVAIVLHQNEPDQFHHIFRRDLKSVNDEFNKQHLRLDLSSGSKMHLKLQKRSLFHPDTQFIDHTRHGFVKRSTQPEDCYATGDMEVDGVNGGFASLALCDGLHGTAFINGIEYYIHPVEHEQGIHHVHILSRRAASDNETTPEMIADGIPAPEELVNRYRRSSGVNKNTYKTATSFVIEMAMFNDAKYWSRLRKIAPGREDEYNLVTMAATNALYSDKEKVGYDARIKVKLYENWIEDPAGYAFQENIFTNLNTFCKYTRSRYNYDMHFLHTGVTKHPGNAVGVAYMSGVCGKFRCGNTYSTSFKRFVTIAHEIGHNLGFNHHKDAKCPEEIKKLGGGFMGGGNPRDFSPCNKWELQELFRKGKGMCLFEETRKVETTDEFLNLPRVLAGQYHDPDEGCEFLAGKDYKLFRPFDFRGSAECAAWMCINRNKESPEYLRIKRTYAKIGYTCNEERFCDDTTCASWDKPGIGWNSSYLRENKGENHWSEWSQDWSTCSSTCGVGVQLKRRHCIFSDGFFLSPYCRGPSVKIRRCNIDPCPGEDVPVNSIRQSRGDEVCERYFSNNVTLHLKKGATYLPKSKGVWVTDKANQYLDTKSCFFMCQRSPNYNNYIDSIYPDGTPCTDSKKSPHKRIRFNIELRCVDGACMEISDCPGNEEKDACGVCGGDPTHCVNKALDRSDDVAEGERKLLGVLPAGTRSIDMNMKWWENRGVRMELWTADGDKIIGAGGRFFKTHYRGNDYVSFAGTTWTYDHGQYIRADGPTDQDLVVKVLRQSRPIKKIYVTYLLPETP